MDYKDITETFSESDMDAALLKFNSKDPRVRNEDGYATTGYDTRDGFWNPDLDKYKD